MEKLKILVVDDESRMRKLVRDFLVKKDFIVLEAEDGAQAVDIFFSTKDISLIILDVMMPKMDGWQVCREIRELFGRANHHADGRSQMRETNCWDLILA